jgi:hypothetical protein
MDLEKVGYVCLALVAVAWLTALFVGLVAAFPFGLIGLVALVGIGALLAKVVRERRASVEDDYYTKNVER